MKEINELWEALHGAEPLVDLNAKSARQSEYEKAEALATMYRYPGFRKFLEEAYQAAVITSALKATTEVEVAFAKGRALTFKELLVKAKTVYEQMERLKLYKELKQAKNAAHEKR